MDKGKESRKNIPSPFLTRVELILRIGCLIYGEICNLKYYGSFFYKGICSDIASITSATLIELISVEFSGSINVSAELKNGCV